MGCRGGKIASPKTPDRSVGLGEIEERIFTLLQDNFCASGLEAALFGQLLKDEALVKLQSKRKKIEVTEKELIAQTPADYFINKIALVDPVEGEVVITYERVMAACQKFEPDEMYMLYERLRHIKVAKLRDAHGTDIVSIVDGAGDVRYSECGRRRALAKDSGADRAPPVEDAAGDVFDARNMRLT